MTQEKYRLSEILTLLASTEYLYKQGITSHVPPEKRYYHPEGKHTGPRGGRFSIIGVETDPHGNPLGQPVPTLAPGMENESVRAWIERDSEAQHVLNTLSQYGDPYVVGGGVRDALLGVPSKDVDIEVYGLTIDELSDIVQKDLGGKQNQVGKIYGVFKVGDFDISLPRTETKVGDKHTDFDVEPNPNLSPELAARRRDFTINALMYDYKNDKVLDFFGGIQDLEAKRIKHVSPETFVEDPLRVYRAAQFASRFDFSIDPSTQELARSMDLSEISNERVFGEFEKLLLKSPTPSTGIQALDDMGVLDTQFSEISALKDTHQRSDYHAEGDVFIHTKMTLDKAAEIIQRFPDEKDKTIIMLAALCHDLGKPETTTSDGRAIGHEAAGVPITEEFLGKLTNDRDILATVPSLVENHLKPLQYHRDGASDAAFRRLINKHGTEYLNLLSAVSEADASGRLVKNPDGSMTEHGNEENVWFRDRIKQVSEAGGLKEGKIAPLLTGNDLKGLGFKEGRELGDILRDVQGQQEEGEIASADEALDYVRNKYQFATEHLSKQGITPSQEWTSGFVPPEKRFYHMEGTHTGPRGGRFSIIGTEVNEHGDSLGQLSQAQPPGPHDISELPMPPQQGNILPQPEDAVISSEAEEREWIEDNIEYDWSMADEGEEVARVIWGSKAGDTLEVYDLDSVGYADGPSGLRGIHVGDPDFWRQQLQDDYGLDAADAQTIKIRTEEGDAYLPDQQYNIPPEVGEAGEANVLVTKRTQLEYGKDWVFEGESFEPKPQQAEEAPSVEPKVHVTNDYSLSPGNGRKIAKAELPDVLYHVSPHHQKIQSSGTILALRGDEEQVHGLGGPQTKELNNAAYFTTDPEHAKFMQKEMLRAGEIARLGVPTELTDYTDSDWVKIKELLNKYVDEDAQYIHSRLQAAADKGLAEIDEEIDSDDIHTALYEQALEPLIDIESDPPAGRETRHFVTLYQRNRADIADFLDDYFDIAVEMTEEDTKQWFPLVQNPLFVGDPLVNFRDATPDTVGISEVSRESVPDNALVRVDTAGDFLGTREVAIHADLSIKKEIKKSNDLPELMTLLAATEYLAKQGEGSEGWTTGYVPPEKRKYSPTGRHKGPRKGRFDIIGTEVDQDGNDLGEAVPTQVRQTPIEIPTSYTPGQYEVDWDTVDKQMIERDIKLDPTAARRGKWTKPEPVLHEGEIGTVLRTAQDLFGDKGREEQRDFFLEKLYEERLFPSFTRRNKWVNGYNSQEALPLMEHSNPTIAQQAFLRYKAASYLGNDLINYFSENLSMPEGGKDGFRKAFPNSTFDGQVLSGLQNLESSDPTSRLVRVVDELYSNTKFSTIHRLAKDDWEADSTGGYFSWAIQESVGRQFDGDVQFFQGAKDDRGLSLAKDNAEQLLESKWEEEELGAKPTQEDIDEYVRVHKALSRWMLDLAFPDTDTLTVYRGTTVGEIADPSRKFTREGKYGEITAVGEKGRDKLYRRARLKDEVREKSYLGEEVELQSNPLTSWTIKPYVAFKFSAKASDNDWLLESTSYEKYQDEMNPKAEPSSTFDRWVGDKADEIVVLKSEISKDDIFTHFGSYAFLGNENEVLGINSPNRKTQVWDYRDSVAQMIEEYNQETMSDVDKIDHQYGHFDAEGIHRMNPSKRESILTAMSLARRWEPESGSVHPRLWAELSSDDKLSIDPYADTEESSTFPTKAPKLTEHQLVERRKQGDKQLAESLKQSVVGTPSPERIAELLAAAPSSDEDEKPVKGTVGEPRPA